MSPTDRDLVLRALREKAEPLSVNAIVRQGLNKFPTPKHYELVRAMVRDGELRKVGTKFEINV